MVSRWNAWGPGLLGADPNSPPDSKVVQTWDEFSAPWRQGAATAATAAANASTLPDKATYDAQMAGQSIGNLANASGYSQDGLQNIMQQMMSVYGGSNDPNQIAMTQQVDPYWSQTQGFNPDSAKAGFNAAAASGGAGIKAIADEWNAKVARQQTGYQNLLGGNYQGGFVNENYSQPFYGNVSAAASGLGGPASSQLNSGSFGTLSPALGQSTPNGMGANGQMTGFGTLNQMMPGAAPQQQQGQFGSGWGGPFSIR